MLESYGARTLSTQLTPFREFREILHWITNKFTLLVCDVNLLVLLYSLLEEITQTWSTFIKLFLDFVD